MEVEVRRSRRRTRTVSAYREEGRVVVLMPARFSKAEEKVWVDRMVTKLERSERRRRLTDEKLAQRATQLSHEYLGGLARPESVRWVGNQRSRWGSCTPADGSIRISDRVRGMPGWVLDYVLVHELAHLIEPSHNEKFWGWVENYPKTEKAMGFLEGWSAGHAFCEPEPADGPDPDPASQDGAVVD